MQSLNSDSYKYLDELKYMINLLKMNFSNKLEIVSESYSSNHVSQPANIEAFYHPKNFRIHVIFDSGRINVLIKKNEAELALHRYLLNQGKYDQEMFKFDAKLDNMLVVQNLVKELKTLLEDGNIYFYLWEGEKRYKLQGERKIKLKTGEF